MVNLKILGMLIASRDHAVWRRDWSLNDFDGGGSVQTPISTPNRRTPDGITTRGRPPRGGETDVPIGDSD